MIILPLAVRKQIADESVRLVIPIILILILLTIPLYFVFTPGQYSRLAPNLVGLLLLLPAWIFISKGRTMQAFNLCILAAIVPILTGMALNGGVHAPVFVGIIAAPCSIVFVYGIGPAVFVAIFLLAMGLIFTQLTTAGILPNAYQTPGDFYILLNHGIWVVMTLVFFSIPMRMLSKMLSEKEKQLEALQSSMKEKLQAEEKLNQLAVVVEQASDEIIITDPSGTIVYVNPSTAAATGYSSDELIGKNPRILQSGRHDDTFYKTLWETIAKGMTWKNRIWNRSKDNRLVLHDVVITPIMSNDHQISGYASVRRDITEMIRMQDRMVQSEKMMALGGLAAGMAHEINNPLGIILQTTQNIVRRLDPDFPKNREQAAPLGLDLNRMKTYLSLRSIDTYLENVRVAGERAAKIVKSMLEFSRTGDSEKKLCNVNKIIDDVLEMAAGDYDLKKKYDFKTINIIKHYSNMDGLWCLESEIGQVLLNIIKNAAQAMAENKKDAGRQPQMIITTSQEKEKIRIEIEDNGPGMDEEIKKEIFQPFYTTKPPGQGTGLGLSISYFIINYHHQGNLEVKSEKGKGSCFIIELPKGTYGNDQ